MVYTITFGECVENHIGNQQIGKIKDKGFTKEELDYAYTKATQLGYTCEYYDLRSALPENVRNEADEAYILIIRNGCHLMSGRTADELFTEMNELSYDSKYFSRKHKNEKNPTGVVNKHARHNACIADQRQNPDYPNGLGTVHPFSDLPITNIIRQNMSQLLGETGKTYTPR